MKVLFRFPVRRALPAALAITLGAVANLASAATAYQETYEDKLSHCVNLTTGKFTFATSQSFVGDTSDFNQFTTVNIVVGDVTVSKQLGADCQFRPGVTHARVQQVVTLPSGGGALALDVQLSWAGNVLNAVVRGFPPLSGSPIGDTIYATGTPGLVNGTVSGSINFVSASQNITVNASVPVSGTLTQKTKNSCSSSFNIKRVKVGGAQ